MIFVVSSTFLVGSGEGQGVLQKENSALSRREVCCKSYSCVCWIRLWTFTAGVIPNCADVRKERQFGLKEQKRGLACVVITAESSMARATGATVFEYEGFLPEGSAVEK